MTFTALERDIIEWVAAHCEVLAVAEQLRRAVFVRREYTGVGLYTYCGCPEELPSLPPDTPRPLFGPHVESRELKWGAGSLVWHEDGHLTCLEVFAYGDSFPESMAEYRLSTSTAAVPQGDPVVDSTAILLPAKEASGSALPPISRPLDEQLLGTWQSDADRTIARMGEHGPIDAKREAALRELFGKLRVTYTATSYTTELDGVTETGRYEVLGQDKISIVIHWIRTKPLPLELSEFTIIYFDGPDSYWLNGMDGGIQEYFKRVTPSDEGSGKTLRDTVFTPKELNPIAQGRERR